MKLVVGFITYNNTTSKYLPDFLASLKGALSFLDRDDYRVLAWDNSEESASNVEEMKKYDFVQYVGQKENLGFARAYNKLIRTAVDLKSKYFLVINPDMLLERDSISKLIYSLDNNGDLASVAPKILQWDFEKKEKTKIIDSLGLELLPGLRFVDMGQGKIDNGQLNNVSILGPSGAGGLFRMSALEQVVERGEYFDESFFMYKEDCDLSYRLYLTGLKSALVSDSIIYHDRTAVASGQGIYHRLRDRSKKSKKVRAWSFRGQNIIFIKHWKKQSFVNKIRVVLTVLSMFVFSLIFERFVLKKGYNIKKSL